jgi:hypothetical protein
MATWIVHLRIAEALLSSYPELQPGYLSIGSVAPDSGIPDEKWEKFDPPAHLLHFDHGDPLASYRLADLDFYRQYILPASRPPVDWRRASFLLGYFFHLATDNLWAEQIDHPTRQRWSKEFEADREFIWEVKRDWYGLDFEYVRSHPQSIFWVEFLPANYLDDYLPFLPQKAVRMRIQYIKEFYQRTDVQLETRLIQRPNLYLRREEMDDFVEQSVKRLREIMTILWSQEVPQVASCLQIPFETRIN